MLNTIIEWFKNMSEGWQIAIFGAAVTFVGGLFALFKWLFSKKDDSHTPQNSLQQTGSGHTAAAIDGNHNTTNVAGRDVNLGIDGDAALNQLVSVSKEAGQSKNEIKHLEEKNEKLKDTIRTLEGQLAQRQVLVGPGQQQTPQPTQEAKELAKLITENDGPYAQALKAIAEGNNKKADGLLDGTQQFLDHVQQKKDEAQAKIYMARMQNASYAGRPQDALQWCDKLKPFADDDPQILNEMATVYYENAMYEKAEPLMKRVVEISEKSLGKDDPNVAMALNNLAQLYQATNRLAEAEPMYKRALAIDEASFDKDHPDMAIDLNNLAMLYHATNRLSEAEPMFKRALAIFEKSLGPNHPKTITVRKNWDICRKKM
jgi:tetratricopeptide (TPR) repeat protein